MVSNKRRVGEAEHLAGILLRGGDDVDTVRAEGDDVAALRYSSGEVRHVVTDDVERAEPQDKA
jgi:hypothetical protein